MASLDCLIAFVMLACALAGCGNDPISDRAGPSLADHDGCPLAFPGGAPRDCLDHAVAAPLEASTPDDLWICVSDGKAEGVHYSLFMDPRTGRYGLGYAGLALPAPRSGLLVLTGTTHDSFARFDDTRGTGFVELEGTPASTGARVFLQFFGGADLQVLRPANEATFELHTSWELFGETAWPAFKVAHAGHNYAFQFYDTIDTPFGTLYHPRGGRANGTDFDFIFTLPAHAPVSFGLGGSLRTGCVFGPLRETPQSA